MSDLPEGWATAKVSDLTTKVGSGSTPKGGKRAYHESGIPLIRSMNVHFDGFRLKGLAFIDDAQAEKLQNVVVESGDVLLNITGASIGRVTTAPDNMEGARVNQHVSIIRPNDALSSKFLSWFLASPDQQSLIDRIQVGATRQALTKTMVLDFKIPLPPLAEQRRIVARIEELFSRLDAGVAALRHAKAQLQRYRQSVLAAAVTGQLTQAWREQHPDTELAEELLERILEQRRESWSARGQYKEPVATDSLPLDLPTTWTITNIDSVISGIEAGKNFKCDERPPTEGETGLVKISAVTWGRFDELESKTVTRDDQIREEHLIHTGDFLLSRANTLELVGAPVIVEQITRQLMLSDKVLRFRFIERLEKFALFWLRSKLGRKEIESRATGNQLSMRNIAQASLRAIPLPLPPLAEQVLIVAEVEARTTTIDHLEAELDRQITRSNHLRQSTLAAAFTGNLTSNA